MKSKALFLSGIFLNVSCAILLAYGPSSGFDHSEGHCMQRPSPTLPSGCTVITVVKGNTVFFGGNDDFNNPDQYYWVEQGDSSRYGVIWIGDPDNPQQGVNEKGLAYDANGLPRFEVNPHPERIPVKGEYYHNYLMQIMHECSNVEEVIHWVNTHQRFPYMHDQMHFADKSGDAVIISAGTDGEMVFTRKKPGDGFLVSTNFNVANPDNGYTYPCWRFEKANELLQEFVEKVDPPDFRIITSVMDAVHEESASWTIETMVADLVNGVIYLYYFYQYDDPVIINVKDELANPREAGPLSRLFPQDVQEEAARRYREVTKTIRINNITGLLWSCLIILSLILLLFLPERKKGLKFWIPATVALGPFALVLKLFTQTSGNLSTWRKALVETTGNMTPLVIAYLVAQIILVLSMLSGGVSQQEQLLIILGVPLLAAWILFHSPLLALAGKKNFFRFLFKRFPQVLVTTFLGLGGIFPVSMVLVNRTITMSQLIPLSPWIVMTWAALIVAGGLIGGFFVYLYELWAVKKGYQAWNVFAGNEGEVTTPGLRKVWWWIIISFLVLLAGLIVGVLLLKAMTG